MKGYFSQLARRSGLSFPNPSNRPGHVSSEPAVAPGPKASVAPIEVEEVTFTASSPAAGSDVSLSKMSDPSRISENQPASLVTPNDVFTSPHENTSVVADANLSQPETGTSPKTPVIRVSNELTAPDESRVQFVAPEPQTTEPATEQIVFSEGPFEQSRPGVTAESQSLSEEVETIELLANDSRIQTVYEAPEVSVDLKEVQSVEISETVETRLPKPANVKTPLEQDRKQLFQDQLKEVMAWINSPPDVVEQPSETFEVIEPRHDTVVIREREQGRPVERPIPREPEVQDLSLSIGTISIVVEEPKQDHPVSMTQPQQPHPAPQPVAPEPTRLSRYYLRNL